MTTSTRTPLPKALYLLAAWAALATAAPAGIIDSCTESIDEARGREFTGSKGGRENNKLTNTTAGEPVRKGKTAFKHWVNRKGERAELAMDRTEIGGTYWYGWSMYVPEDFDHTGHYTIVMQLATWPTPRNGKFPGGGNGHMICINGDGRVVYRLQHAGDTKDSENDEFDLGRVEAVKGKWVDFVMHAKWTGDKDGFLRLWVKVGDGRYEKKIAYAGRTWWNDEGKGPYLKFGLYIGDPGWKGPAARTLYTDEYRLGDEKARFEDVAPGGEAAP